MKERRKKGLDEEVRRLVTLFDKDLPSMSAIGLNEHAYARRQMTWFKRDKRIAWIKKYGQANKLVAAFIAERN